MAAFVKINDWVKYMTQGANISSDQFTLALSNTAPGSEASPPAADGNGILANVTQVSYANCSSRNITTTSANQAAGTLTLVLQDLTLTATGDVGPFRYVYVYDDTVAADPLVCYYDYASSITVHNGETFLFDLSASGLFTVA